MPSKIVTGSTDSYPTSDPDLPDLTGMLKLVRIAATGSFSVVYRCLYTDIMEVAVKAITFPPSFDLTEVEDFMRKARHRFRIWGRLRHPNIVPFLGTASGKDFGSDYPCIVSLWMKNGTLNEYVKLRGTELSSSSRIHLIKGLVAGLEFLHSQDIIHGSFHPGNILIDDDLNARLIDFGSTLSLFPLQDQLSYLWTDDIRPSRPMWAAPELLYPELYPKLRSEATLHSDIYSLGNIIVHVLSGRYPWRDRGEAENRLKKFQNPLRPTWPVNMPDGVWEFIERCWSPRDPGARPSAQEALSFSTGRLEKLLQPSPGSDINVVLLGALGSGKSSIINLLVGEKIAETSSGVEPCTERPRSYQVTLDGLQFRMWDTMGFFPTPDGPVSHLLPYEHAYAVLQNLPDGVNLILLCADKDAISASLRRLYWLVNDFFYAGRAPIAFIVTHFDTPDEEWWERNKRNIAERTTIPIHSIPHACITTGLASSDQSKHALKGLLHTYATAVVPTPLCPNISSFTTSSDLITHCRLTNSEAMALVERFRRPLRPLNVVFWGETGTGIGSIINFVAGQVVADTNPDAQAIVLGPHSYRISTGMRQVRILDAVGADEGHVDRDAYIGALENAHRVVRGFKSRIDLLVFCKRCGSFTSEEQNRFKLFDEVICKGKSPIAVLLTHIDPPESVDEWWQMNGKDLVRSMGGYVIGHSYTPQLDGHDHDGVKADKALLASRFSIEDMLEDCNPARVSGFRRVGLDIITRRYTIRQKMTVKGLVGRYGLSKGQAKRIIQLYKG